MTWAPAQECIQNEFDNALRGQTDVANVREVVETPLVVDFAPKYATNQ